MALTRSTKSSLRDSRAVSVATVLGTRSVVTKLTRQLICILIFLKFRTVAGAIGYYGQFSGIGTVGVGKMMKQLVFIIWQILNVLTFKAKH